jgi:ABC-type transporter Mla MlaB component
MTLSSWRPFAEMPAMLRIARIDDRGRHTRPALKLEGKLFGPWVIELSRACEELSVPPGILSLNLSAVTFIDSAGLTLLRDLIGRGATISGCSGFIEELLSEGGSRG